MSAAQAVPGRPSAALPSLLRPSGLGWLVWRRQRTVLLLWLAVLVLALAGAVVFRARMTGAIAAHGLASCSFAGGAPVCDDGALFGLLEFQAGYGQVLRGVGLALLTLPALAGVVLGAPLLSRDLESGTWKLVLAQSVSRARWAGANLAGAAAAAVAGSAVLAALYRWLRSPAPDGMSRVGWGGRAFFGTGGPVLPASVLLGLAVGAAAGVLLRRVLPAMALTLPVVLLLQYGLESVRPYLVGRESAPMPRWPLSDSSWILDAGVVTPGGARVSFDECRSGADHCAGLLASGRAYTDFHPAAHYWPLQGVESLICLVLAAGLLAFTLRWAARRLG
ncbi:hypothetical protein [Kitasatospora herbaricolor]|uniref:hypothetical protein n=1 Tax=Kitasatospora herbaricolor TaxID=68217 RepID=UPI0036DF60A1